MMCVCVFVEEGEDVGVRVCVCVCVNIWFHCTSKNTECSSIKVKFNTIPKSMILYFHH